MAKVTAISSLGWAHYTLYEALPRMAARGFKKIEIASFGSYCFHFNFGSPTPFELKKILDDLDLQPICLNYFTDFQKAWDVDEIEVFVKDCTKKITQLNEVGIPLMTMGFGVRNDCKDQECQLSNAVKAYNRVGEIAEKYNVRMLLEVPHLYNIMHTEKQVSWVFERIESSNVGALVDSSHWGIINYDIDLFFQMLGKRLWHIHLRDSAGQDTADMKQDLELTPGNGVVDFCKFANALDKADYEGDVTIEFEYRDITFDAIEREYDKGLKYLENNGWELPEGVKQKGLFSD